MHPAMDRALRALLYMLYAAGTWAGAADTPAAPAPRVEAVYPSGATLPANHLKFYIHFSEPMRKGVFLDHCRIVDGQGRAALEPFRETELWSEDGKRLTLWLHPGRQKTGVNLNTEFGPVLLQGARYSLVISGTWPSEDGVPCGQDTEKTFFAAARETRQLDVTDWKLTPPAAGSKKPFEVRFPTPLDHALLMRCLRVIDDGGKAVAGSVSTTESERLWRFTPATAWTGVPHRLAVESILEDLAGNSLARPFEVDLQGTPPKKVPASIVLPFTPVVVETAPGKD
jgi:hypothetical protein